jgi:hypothetical protein
MNDNVPEAIPLEYLSWDISAERQRHEWIRLRKSLVRMRLRLVFFGHAAYFIVCGCLCYFGAQCATFVSLGFWSLLFISIYLLLMEYLLVRMLPAKPPRFVIRKSGLTEYGCEGPLSHWEWQRARQISIETDGINPAYRSLIVTLNGANPLFRKYNRCHFPLPETEHADHDIVAALARALKDNRIELEPQSDGAVSLRSVS